MSWKFKDIPEADGYGTMFGAAKGGIAYVPMVVDEDDLHFYAIVHVRTGIRMGYLFCAPNKVEPIVEEILDLQDWNQVAGSGDVTEETRQAMKLFRTRHLVLNELPKELGGVLVRSNDKDFDDEPAAA